MKKLSLLLTAVLATGLAAFAGCSSTTGTAADAGADSTATPTDGSTPTDGAPTDGSVTSVCDTIKTCPNDKPAEIAELKAACKAQEASGKCLTELRALYKCVEAGRFCNDAGQSDIANTACAAETTALVACTTPDSGGGDAGSDAPTPPPVVNGCTSFVDATGGAAEITWDLSVGTAPGRCLKIREGQSVTWTGSFTSHPLKASGGTTPSPIVNGQPGDTDVTIQFDAAGVYGYVCEIHGSMTGAIQVVP